MDTKCIKLVSDVGIYLSTKGMRSVTLHCFYHQVQRAAAKRGQFAPGWEALLDALQGLEDYTVSVDTVTLPATGVTAGQLRPCLLTEVNRVIDGINTYLMGPSHVSDAEGLIEWVRETLVSATPEREEG